MQIASTEFSYSDLNKNKGFYSKLSSHYKDFIQAAESYGKIIIDEIELDNSLKTIKKITGGKIGGDKFEVRN